MPKTSVSLWPFTTRLAVALVPLALAVLLAAWGLFREPLHLESASSGWILLGIVLLGLLPVLLVVLDAVALSGGSIEVGQVKVALTAAATAQPLVVAPPNVTPGTNISDSGSTQIIEGLTRAQSAKTVVVGLETGHAWWETRLLILAEGAVRLGRPQVVVFTATRQGKVDQFVGWAHAQDVRDCILRANPSFQRAHDTATGMAAEARQVDAVGGVQPPALAVKPLLIHAPGSPGINPFLEEQMLADALSPLEESPLAIGVGRLRDILDPVLHTGAVDRTDLDSAWFRKALRSDEEYVALTDTGTYLALMTRANIVTEVLLAITKT